MILNGRDIADDILTGLKEHRKLISGEISLGIVVAPNDPVIESFVRIKSKVAAQLNVRMIRGELAENTTEAAMNIVLQFKRDPSIHGIIVQLPMPEGVDTNAVLSEVPAEKDLDGINPFTRESERPARAPVARAVQEILARSNVQIAGAKTVVVGAGRLVGLPSAALLEELGANVSMFTLDSGSMDDLKEADIIISGAGQPHFIKPEHIKPGVVLIDAGTSESAGMIQGDADPSCAEIASIFTPVPGGVGPIAVAMIFKNLFDLIEK